MANRQNYEFCRCSCAIGPLFLAVALVAFFFSDFAAHAQVLYGSVVGNVIDPANQPVAGATVQATEMQQGITQQAISDSSGFYRFSELLPGTWKVTVSAPGFITAETD